MIKQCERKQSAKFSVFYNGSDESIKSINSLFDKFAKEYSAIRHFVFNDVVVIKKGEELVELIFKNRYIILDSGSNDIKTLHPIEYKKTFNELTPDI